MKNKTLKLMLLTIVATSLSLSCSKDRLPKITQEGKIRLAVKLMVKTGCRTVEAGLAV